MAKWVCRWCIITNGLRGSDLPNWPEVGDEEAIALHIESQHHMPVRRDGESPQRAVDRLRREYPESGYPETCKCPTCSRVRALEARGAG